MMRRLSIVLCVLFLWTGCKSSTDPTITGSVSFPGQVVYHPIDAFYTVNLLIDGQEFNNVLLDTGSSNLLVFGDATLCPNCIEQSGITDYTPSTFTPSGAPLENGQTFTIKYGSGSGVARMYNAKIAVSATDPGMDYPLGVIISGTKINSILGLSYPSNIVGFDDFTPLPFIDAYVLKNNLPNLFTLTLCPDGKQGSTFSIGSVSDGVPSDSINYTSVIPDSLFGAPVYDLYNVTPIALWVKGESAPLATFPRQDQNVLTFVDSGTPLMYLDSVMMAAIQSYYENLGIPVKFWDLLDSQSVSIDETQYALLKPFQVEFPGVNGGSFKVDIDPRTYTFNIGSTLHPSYISGFATALSLTNNASIKAVIFGDVFMQNVSTVFDRETQRLGFGSNAALCH